MESRLAAHTGSSVSLYYKIRSEFKFEQIIWVRKLWLSVQRQFLYTELCAVKVSIRTANTQNKS